MRTRPKRRRGAAGAALGLSAAVVALGVTLSGCGGSDGSGRSGDRSRSEQAADRAAGAAVVTGTSSVPAAEATHPSTTVSVAPTAVGQTIPSGFLGFSFEFKAVRAYTGSDPRQINPVLVQLIRNVTPGRAPVLRIGGDSTDDSYAPVPGVPGPGYVAYPLTPSWMATTGALARETGAHMIMGLNLAAGSPALAAAEARDYIRAFGRTAIEALEIGNEPNIYSSVTVYHTAGGAEVHARAPGFGYPAFRRQFQATVAASPSLTLAGPALAAGPVAGPGSWLGTMPDFLARQQRVAIMTVHRYPLRNCFVPPTSAQYPTIQHLLAGYATVGLAASLTPWVRVAHDRHRLLRVDELNSVACRGRTGVSDTFASALWVTDALFALARAGVDGINMHTLPDAAYELFHFRHRGGRWSGTVRPVYYGLQLFAQAAPAGARLLKVTRGGKDDGLSAWATRAPDRSVRVVLINKDRRRTRTVRVRLPPGSAGSATVERMLAPDVTARRGVTLGGRTYGASTSTGRLATPEVAQVSAASGAVTLSVPHGSAALVTLPAAS
jgi:hypothetical protein